jgi:hypothetical protein
VRVRTLVWGLLSLLVLPFVAAAVWLAVLFVNGWGGDFPPERDPLPERRPAAAEERASRRQREARAEVGRAGADRILFGDLHVHTVYSADAHLQSVVIRDRISPNPPADACDFARYCSQLDFWSINDHAESLTPDLWRRTVEAVRQCNAAAGDPADPDLVTFLGWEWSHVERTRADRHYGHKNIVLRDFEPGRTPTRPIASAPGPPRDFIAISIVAPLVRGNLGEWAGFHRYARGLIALEDCPEGVPVRELPADCRESATDPATLFAKLDDWGLPALVIPHGLSWGITNPPHADLAFQIGQHDPRWQRLLEVYSGHGSSEIYRDLDPPTRDAEGEWICPEPAAGFEPCCHRAAELARARCQEPRSADCEEAVARARRGAIGPWDGVFPPARALPGTTASDWGDCGQLRDAFLPAFSYRPRQSAQYAFALARDAGGRPTDARFRWGLIGSSDTHRSRPGTGYRERGRQVMTDGIDYPLPGFLLDERAPSYYYTGGLAAVHAPGRDRGSIFEALRRRRVYGTSGDRILLWFDLLHPDGSRRPMGSEVRLHDSPRFEVRAVGAWRQEPGCPDFVRGALAPERIAELCLGSCYNPTAERKRITRIEVVRIRPQANADEAVAPLIDDPWQVLACPGRREGCVARFEDPDLARESVYYVRAIQEPTPAVNGDPLRCQRNADGACVQMRPCGLREDGFPDDCLAPVEERAWSSPIFVDYAIAPEAG